MSKDVNEMSFDEISVDEISFDEISCKLNSYIRTTETFFYFITS